MEVTSQSGEAERGPRAGGIGMGEYGEHPRSMEDIVAGLQRPTYSKESKSYPRYTRTSFNLTALLDLSKPPFKPSTPAEVKRITARVGQPTKSSLEHSDVTPDRNIKSRLQTEQAREKTNTPRKGDETPRKSGENSEKNENASRDESGSTEHEDEAE